MSENPEEGNIGKFVSLIHLIWTSRWQWSRLHCHLFGQQLLRETSMGPSPGPSPILLFYCKPGCVCVLFFLNCWQNYIFLPPQFQQNVTRGTESVLFINAFLQLILYLLVNLRLTCLNFIKYRRILFVS